MVAGGDNASYVRGLAAVVAHHDVAFQAYFFRDGWESELRHGRSALNAYRAAFGTHGYADGPDAGTDVISCRALASGAGATASDPPGQPPGLFGRRAQGAVMRQRDQRDQGVKQLADEPGGSNPPHTH